MQALLGKALTRRFYHRPIFLVGASRSGTIVLYKALGTHPSIFSMPSEDPFITSIGAEAWSFEYGEEKDYLLESIKLPKGYLFEKLRLLCFESAAGPNYGARNVVKYALRHGVDLARKRHWCVKTFPLEDHAKGLLKLYPEASFVYIVRNGINVVQSRTKFPAFREQPFESHCRFWANAANKFRYLYDFERATVVRQEELLSAPQELFERIFRHVGLAHSENPIQFVRTTLVHSLGDKATHENVDVRKSLEQREPAFAKWSSDQREVFKEICGPAMRELGYEIPF